MSIFLKISILFLDTLFLETFVVEYSMCFGCLIKRLSMQTIDCPACGELHLEITETCTNCGEALSSPDIALRLTESPSLQPTSTQKGRRKTSAKNAEAATFTQLEEEAPSAPKTTKRKTPRKKVEQLTQTETTSSLLQTAVAFPSENTSELQPGDIAAHFLSAEASATLEKAIVVPTDTTLFPVQAEVDITSQDTVEIKPLEPDVAPVLAPDTSSLTIERKSKTIPLEETLAYQAKSHKPAHKGSETI